MRVLGILMIVVPYISLLLWLLYTRPPWTKGAELAFMVMIWVLVFAFGISWFVVAGMLMMK